MEVHDLNCWPPRLVSSCGADSGGSCTTLGRLGPARNDVRPIRYCPLNATLAHIAWRVAETLALSRLFSPRGAGSDRPDRQTSRSAIRCHDVRHAFAGRFRQRRGMIDSASSRIQLLGLSPATLHTPSFTASRSLSAGLLKRGGAGGLDISAVTWPKALGDTVPTAPQASRADDPRKIVLETSSKVPRPDIAVVGDDRKGPARWSDGVRCGSARGLQVIDFGVMKNDCR
jgi:hypothetical protein